MRGFPPAILNNRKARMSIFKGKNDLINETGLVIEGAEGLFEIDGEEDSTDLYGADGIIKPVATVTPSDVSMPAENEEREFIAEGEGAAEPSAGDNGRPRIGERLVSMGIISQNQLATALQEKKISGKLLGEVLVDLGFISPGTLATFLAETSGFDVFDPKRALLDAQALALIDKQTAQRHKILPVSMDAATIRVAMADPYDVVAIDTLRRFAPRGIRIKQLLATPAALSDAIDNAYGYASSISAILKEIEDKDEDALDVVGLSEDRAYMHPVVRLVNALIFESVKQGASDLHFEPEENFIRLRHRIDGVLFTAQIIHRRHWHAVSRRLKIMADMNIADTLSPQSGRIRMNAGGRAVDFRMSVLPTVHGENIVLRVQSRQTTIRPLDALGFGPEMTALIRKAQSRPEGLVLLTGPENSGRTTTLYSMLGEINTVDLNIQTLEDPIEYVLPMVRQSMAGEGAANLNNGMEVLLHQDPDVLFIGEINSEHTARMALQAAMAGHLVYATLHSNDTFGAVARLLDMGLPPGLMAGNIAAIMAQRLARALCPHCKESHTPTEAERALLGDRPEGEETICTAHQGGCDHCSGQGYKGRMAVAEIMLMDEDLDDIVARGASRPDLKSAARRKGLRTMREDGLAKVAQGVLSFEALSKVIAL